MVLLFVASLLHNSVRLSDQNCLLQRNFIRTAGLHVLGGQILGGAHELSLEKEGWGGVVLGARQLWWRPTSKLVRWRRGQRPAGQHFRQFLWNPHKQPVRSLALCSQFSLALTELCD